MPKVTYVQPDGERRTVEVPIGRTAMQGAKDNGIPGILAECGGQCSCATCHCYADAQWAAKLPARQAKEAELIDFVCDPRENSRLSCQILLTESLDGLVLHVPDQQL